MLTYTVNVTVKCLVYCIIYCTALNDPGDVRIIEPFAVLARCGAGMFAECRAEMTLRAESQRQCDLRIRVI